MDWKLNFLLLSFYLSSYFRVILFIDCKVIFSLIDFLILNLPILSLIFYFRLYFNIRNYSLLFRLNDLYCVWVFFKYFFYNCLQILRINMSQFISKFYLIVITYFLNKEWNLLLHWLLNWLRFFYFSKAGVYFFMIKNLLDFMLFSTILGMKFWIIFMNDF